MLFVWSFVSVCRTSDGRTDGRCVNVLVIVKMEEWTTTYAEATRGRTAPRIGATDGSDDNLKQQQQQQSSYVRFSYGTAGFRTKASALDSTCFRSGAFAAARAMAKGNGGWTTGIVITASHNPAPDNGVKLVEPNGGTLPMELESLAEALANADDAEGQIAALRGAMASSSASSGEGGDGEEVEPAARVLVARDTRESGSRLAEEALAGIRAMGVEAVDCGEMTTPQLHYLVWATNAGQPCSELDYFARLSSGYAALIEKMDDDEDDDDATAAGTTKMTTTTTTLVVDCADGVGAQKLEKLGEAVEPYGLRFDLRNRGDASTSSLNDGVGADYVQKSRAPPKRGGFDALPPGTRCVSVDGDADRLIYYQIVDATTIQLFDGDKIATMIADFIARLVRDAAPFLPEKSVRVGVVQTAYANGASTAYLCQALDEPPACVPTGVKHLHHAAEEMYDVGVYFESNGHGTAIFSPKASKLIEDATVEALSSRAMPQVEALMRLAHVQRCVNPAVGDAMSGILLVEAILQQQSPTAASSFEDMYYVDLPSAQTKHVVPDRSKIKTYDAERRVREPLGLQDDIDAAVQKIGREQYSDQLARCFVRPSGTEDCVRVYAEARDAKCVEALTRAVVRAIDERLAGV